MFQFLLTKLKSKDIEIFLCVYYLFLCLNLKYQLTFLL